MDTPTLTITVNTEGVLLIASNVQDAVMLLGLLALAQYTILSKPRKELSPLVIPQLNGGVR